MSSSGGHSTINLNDVRTTGCNKIFRSLVFVFTQLHFGQWSSLPFCLPRLIVQWPARFVHSLLLRMIVKLASWFRVNNKNSQTHTSTSWLIRRITFPMSNHVMVYLRVLSEMWMFAPNQMSFGCNANQSRCTNRKWPFKVPCVLHEVNMICLSCTIYVGSSLFIALSDILLRNCIQWRE